MILFAGKKLKGGLCNLALAAGALALSLAFYEGLVSYLMLRGLGPSAPEVLLKFFRAYYWESPYRQVIQFDPNCAGYDGEVFYRLKPGKCTHEGLRFRNEYSINSLGVRDDERSLSAPEIISIGDSHAMGWGVDQEATYTQLLERRTGMTALNMGISSFGTAREMTFLKRADLSRLKYLIIQYNDNDLEENLAYLKNGNMLKPRPPGSWKAFEKKDKNCRRYVPGAHFFRALRMAVRALKQGLSPQKQAGPAAHAQAFLAVLESFKKPELKNARLLIFDLSNEIHAGGAGPESFAGALVSMSSSGRFKRFAGRIEVLDLGRALNGAEYRNVIDNHINAEGHKLIAETILGHLKKKLFSETRCPWP
ncbi:MAG: hypothetical protein WCK76_08535 [Elusimicrobiota bacterium]